MTERELGLSLSGIQTMEAGTRPIERRTVLAVRWLSEQPQHQEEEAK